MVTKAQQAVQDAVFTTHNEPPALPEYDQEFEHVPDDVALSRLLADLGEDENAGKVNVYKLVNGEFRSQLFLFSCTPAEFDMGMLQDPEYHKDDKEKHMFRVILRNSTGIATAKTLAVMPMAKKELLSVATPPALDLTPIAQLMAAMHEQTQALIRSIATPAQPARTTKEMLEEMMLFKQMFGNDQPAQKSDPMEMFKMAKELAVLINPEAAAASPMMSMLEKYGGPILEAVMTPKTPPVAMPMPAMRMPAGTTPAVEAPPVTPAQESETDVNILQEVVLKQSLNFLTSQAQRNGDVELYADMVVDQAGESILEPLNLPDWFENIVRLCPDAAPHKLWFTALRDEVLAQLLPETDETELTIVETGVILGDNQTPGVSFDGTINPNNSADPANTGGQSGHPGNLESHASPSETGEKIVTRTP